MACTSAGAASSVDTIRPGVTGTPASTAVCRAASLLPSRSIVSGGGPTNTRPAAMTARANAAFSLRNP